MEHAIVPNPPSPWVERYLEHKPALEKALGLPLGQLLGCGAFGCTFDTTDPWCVKLTLDPEEAPVWAVLQELQHTPDSLGAGASRVQDIVTLSPKVKVGRQWMHPHAIVREKVMPLWSGERELSDYSRSVLEIPKDFPYASLFNEKAWVGLEPDVADNLYRFKASLFALAKLREASSYHRKMLTLKQPKKIREYQDARDEAYTEALELFVEGGWYCQALALTIDTLLQRYQLLLSDVHWANIGWRFFSDFMIDGAAVSFGVEGSLVCFDPGTSPYEGSPKIREAFLTANPEPDIMMVRYAMDCAVLETSDAFDATNLAYSRLAENGRGMGDAHLREIADSVVASARRNAWDTVGHTSGWNETREFQEVYEASLDEILDSLGSGDQLMATWSYHGAKAPLTSAEIAKVRSFALEW